MYLIGNEGARVAVNREISVKYILDQLPEMEDRELEMAADFIRGLMLARRLKKS